MKQLRGKDGDRDEAGDGEKEEDPHPAEVRTYSRCLFDGKITSGRWFGDIPPISN